MVKALEHGFQWDRFTDRVKLIAIGTGQVTAAHGYDVSHYYMIGIHQSMSNHAQFPEATAGGNPLTTKALFSL
jgi:hypothetical protein